MPPTPPELARLAEQSRITPAVALPKIDEKAIPRSLRRRLAAEVREALVARHKAGESIKALSREFGISESGLRDLLTAEEMLYRKQPITPEDIDLAVQLYASGLTVKQVVKRLSYPIGTIRRVLRERGVTMRSHSTRQTKGTR
jgi:lambda repressor-like predicted transcriptional regulator